MDEVADGVFRIGLKVGRRPMINAYVADGVLFDAARRQDARRIVTAIAGRGIEVLALTHAHPDHQGAAAAVCDELALPLACHADDVAAMEGRRPMSGGHPISRVVNWAWGGPPRHVDRPLSEGDEVGEFRVIHAPGHSPGEVIFFRPRDRVAICGDVIRNLNYVTGRAQLSEPPAFFNADTELNRTSIARLAALEPQVVLPGHGFPVTDGRALAAFAASVASGEPASAVAA